MNGSILPWADCQVHVRAQAFMAGASVFEGIRAYWNESTKQLHVFHMSGHINRLAESMKVMRMRSTIPADFDAAVLEVLRANEFREDVHIVPVAYVGVGEAWGAMSRSVEEGLLVTAVARPTSPLVANGCHVRVSSWQRISDVSMPPRVKAAANYQNSRLALNEAWADGYDNALLLNSAGNVSEATGACLFMVRNGRICTPPVTASILESLTRVAIIQLCQETLGIEVEERPIDRTELYVASELFVCGSGFEITPVISVDRIEVGYGAPGPVTRRIQNLYFDVVRGVSPLHPEWRTEVYESAAVAGREGE